MAIKSETCLCHKKKSKLYNVVLVIDHYFYLLASVLINSTPGDILCRENVVAYFIRSSKVCTIPHGFGATSFYREQPRLKLLSQFRKKVREIPQKTTDLAYTSQIKNVSFEIIHFLLLSRFC